MKFEEPYTQYEGKFVNYSGADEPKYFLLKYIGDEGIPAADFKCIALTRPLDNIRNFSMDINYRDLAMLTPSSEDKRRVLRVVFALDNKVEGKK
jgi:hypothetical protein